MQCRAAIRGRQGDIGDAIEGRSSGFVGTGPERHDAAREDRHEPQGGSQAQPSRGEKAVQVRAINRNCQAQA